MRNAFLHFAQFAQNPHRENLFAEIAVIQILPEYDFVNLLKLLDREFVGPGGAPPPVH